MPLYDWYGHKLTFAPPCVALLDQNRFIGDTPMGRCCYNQGTGYVGCAGFLFWLCDDCRQMLLDEPHRLTLLVARAVVPTG